MPAAVGVYAGLRWVPADASYAVATRRAEDAITLLHASIDAFGIPAEVDAADLSRESTQEIGFDVLSPDAYRDMGIDLNRGVAIWSRGLGPTIAVPLADPQRFAAELDRRRGPGTVVQVGRAHDADVFTIRPDRDVAIHWTVNGDWFLAHLEVIEEREAEDAWLDQAFAARGGFAGSPDFVAALEHGARRLAAEPPLVALARVPTILAHPLVQEPSTCASTLGAIGRVFVAAGVEGGDARGALVVEVPGGADGARARIAQVPAGWAEARKGAPLVLEVGMNMRPVMEELGRCLGEDIMGEAPADSGRLFVHEIDLGRPSGKGAVVAALRDPAMIGNMLSEIPGIGLLSKKRTVGGVGVTEVNVPGFPRFTYGTSGATTVATVGMSIDPLLTGGLVAGGDELARLELLPQAWPAATWDGLLEAVVGREETRAATVRRLRAWSRGEVVVSLDGSAIVVTAHGTR
jgi:hypothetical protein